MEFFAAGGTGALHKINDIMRKDRTLCRYIEATSQDINQEVKAWSQWVYQMVNDPKHTSKVGIMA